MTTVYVTYPGDAAARFDRDYYVARHLPLVMATRLPGKVARRLGRGAPPSSQMRPAGGVANAALLAACRLEALLPRNPVAGLTAMAWGTVP